MRAARELTSLIVFRDVQAVDDAAPLSLTADYALERMRQEQAAAERAASGAAQDIHQQLARTYAAIASSGAGKAPTGGTGR